VLPVGGAVGKIASKLGMWRKVAKPKKRQERIGGKGGVGVSTATQFSSHAIQRMAERGVSPKMAQITINKGLKFYDPYNKSINYILPNSFASGKHLLIGTDPRTGEIRTVLRGSKNLIKPRMISIPNN
jgi:hypothetical protein